MTFSIGFKEDTFIEEAKRVACKSCEESQPKINQCHGSCSTPISRQLLVLPGLPPPHPDF